jgi:hypothetical protein
MIKRFAVILFFTFLCVRMHSQVSYMYSDGNMNSFTVKEFEVRYDPVQKEESSSGMYSGGEQKAVVITPHQLNKLSALFEEIISDSTCHQNKRSMGSGLLIRYNKTTVEKKVIIKFKSEQLEKIDSGLRELLK